MNSKSTTARLGLAAFIALIGAGCVSEPGAGSEQARAGIEAKSAQWEGAFNAGDGAAIAARYVADGQLLPPGGTTITGTDNIAAFWQSALDSISGGSVELETLEVVAHGDYANEVGRFSIADGDGNTLDQGKYMVLWRDDEGEWKMVRDIWNTNGAPATMPAE